MAAVSEIEWTDSTWTPIRARNLTTGRLGWHCEHVSPGCEFCYAEKQFNMRMGTQLPYKPGHRKDIEIFLDEKMLLAPLKWKKPRKIFVCSMTDLFADFVKDEWIDRVFAVMALCPQHRFQVLTKRAKRMREYCSQFRLEGHYVVSDRITSHDPRDGNKFLLLHDGQTWPLSNLWLGISAEDQARWDERKMDLCHTPAAIRFASFEPLLGPIEQPDIGEFIDWAIVGGESGRNARPMHPDWVRSIRDQCQAVDVAFFMKQWGEHAPQHEINYPGYSGPLETMRRVGKKAAGRLLDGKLHDGMPG